MMFLVRVFYFAIDDISLSGAYVGIWTYSDLASQKIHAEESILSENKNVVLLRKQSHLKQPVTIYIRSLKIEDLM